MKKVDIFYPSYTKKAVTFTIDDGNLQYDEKLISILRPAGIKGTFNLCSNINVGNEGRMREMYDGYEIANHVKYHPFVNYDGIDLAVCDEKFSEENADPRFIYRVDGRDGFFWQIKGNGWRQMTYEGDFIRYIDEGFSELNAIFGEGSIRDFVWPYCEQDNAAVKAHIRATHRSARKTGCTLDTEGFAIPNDKYAWSYNANHKTILEVMEKYESYPDDGELKMFAFGVHAIDFERDGTWDDLEMFAKKYGSRPDTYWYAAVGEIFDYEEAVRSLIVTESKIKNPSDITVYLTVDGEREYVYPKSELTII